MTTVPGDRFIHSLTNYLDSNVGRLQAKGGAQKRNSVPIMGGSLRSSQSFKTTRVSSKAPSSLYGIPGPYMSLLGTASPMSALTITSYMPSSSTLTLDIHHLYFLLVQFEHLGLDVGDPALLGTVPEGGIVDEAELSALDETRSIMSVGSIKSTLSLSTGWNFWNRGSPMAQQQQHRTIHQDIEHIYKFFGRLSALKLQLDFKNPRLIQGYDNHLAGDIRLSLKPFKRLAHLELDNVHPQVLADWPPQTIMGGLSTLVVHGAKVEDSVEVLTTDTTWVNLKRLSLANNNIISLETDVLDRIRNVTDLDLSTNLLADVPAALAHLYNLQSLQLANNMISSVTGLNTVLGNIQELDLRGNRLTMLAGLDRMWALERVDLRDNQIEDVDEVGRLASLPNIEDIWIEGNPFEQLNPDYRVQLFTAFKQYDHDVKLDGSAPSFAERRRVGSCDTPSAVSADEEAKTTPVAAEPAKITRAKSKRVIKLGKQRRASHADAEIAGAAGGPGEVNNQQESEEGQEKHVHRAADMEQAVTITRRKSSASSRRHRLHRRSTQSPSTTDDEGHRRQRSMSPTAFRLKIESMRQEAGTEWLRVLQEMDLNKTKAAVAAAAVNDVVPASLAPTSVVDHA